MPVEDRIDKGVDRVAADVGFFQESLGSRNQQILRKDLVAFEQKPGLQHDAVELQERAIAKRQRAEKGEIDMRCLLSQIVELAEDIAELDGLLPKMLLVER